MAERLHAIIKASAPALSPRTWYGMPAYAKDGKVVCFFQSAQKFKTRYATFGFSDKANLDEGAMWPTDFALKELTAAEEATDRRAREEGGELNTSPLIEAHNPELLELGLRPWPSSSRRPRREPRRPRLRWIERPEPGGSR